MSSLLEITSSRLGWPTRDSILAPKGPGPRLLAEIADEKIGAALRLKGNQPDVRVGVLVADPNAKESTGPLAIVCEFSRPATWAVLREAHRLAWNFARSPLLITVEPHLIRTWTCCEVPAPQDAASPSRLDEAVEPPSFQTLPAQLGAYDSADLGSQAAEILHWVTLATGVLPQHYPGRFRQEFRADRTLLANLKHLRGRLQEMGLEVPIVHDLIARIIFLQFLFDRKDSNGRAALDADRLKSLHRQGELAEVHESLSELLGHRDDAYALFKLLNERFNGDLFPDTGDRAWAREMACVREDHLELLGRFVAGTLEMTDGQLSLWRLYSFDAVPLEFISSVYEEFVSKRPGVVYTPSFLVDYLLDAVLPWDGDEWDLRVLDPACGSGIFLVKVFQRLIHRWKNAHPGVRIDASQLRRLLERNLLGVDKDEQAVRVASFSLYLAMCDEIDPRHYWNQVRFPKLRHRRLLAVDFFSEDAKGIRTVEDGGDFDLVVGNVPWARGSLGDSEHGEEWAGVFGWHAFDRNIGPLFLPKAAALTARSGRVALLQPATLLFSDFAETFRQQLFSKYNVEEVTNLSALRFQLFDKAISPACIVTLQVAPPSAEPIVYISPKPTHQHCDHYQITVEPHDVGHVHRREALEFSPVWSTLAWGGRRDLALVQKCANGPTIEKLRQSGRAITRNGLMWGTKKRRSVPELKGRAELRDTDLETRDGIHLRTDRLPRVTDPRIHHKDQSDLSAFAAPQLLIKRSWSTTTGRFQSALVPEDDPTGGVVCSQNFVSVHVRSELASHLEAAWLSYTSQFAVYYHLLVSGRIASYRPNLRVGELLRLPYPTPREGLLEGIRNVADVDARLRQAVGLDDVEWVLVEDLNSYTMPDFKGGPDSPGRHPTASRNNGDEQFLSSYCKHLIRVLQTGFGGTPSATVFQQSRPLPVRLVAVHFDWPDREKVVIEPIESGDLLEKLVDLGNVLCARSFKNPAHLGRVARIYHSMLRSGYQVPTVFVVKPDQRRYWTRSVALRDADDIAADALLWRNSAPEARKPPAAEIGDA